MYVRIESVVEGQRHDAVLARQILHHEPGRGYLNAYALASLERHGAAIIVGQ